MFALRLWIWRPSWHVMGVDLEDVLGVEWTIIGAAAQDWFCVPCKKEIFKYNAWF